MKKFYVDSCIWRDLIEDRKAGLQPLGEFAFQFFKKCVEKDCRVYYSKLVIDELLKHLEKEVVEDAFKEYEEILIFVEVTKEQVKEQYFLSSEKGVPLGDARHAILARDNGCLLISRDKHFLGLEDLVESGRPEELEF